MSFVEHKTFTLFYLVVSICVASMAGCGDDSTPNPANVAGNTGTGGMNAGGDSGVGGVAGTITDGSAGTSGQDGSVDSGTGGIAQGGSAGQDGSIESGTGGMNAGGDSGVGGVAGTITDGSADSSQSGSGGTSTGGTSTGGAAGAADQDASIDSGTGGATSPWKNGVMGKALAPIILSQNGGPVLGIARHLPSKPMNLPLGEGGSAGSDDSGTSGAAGDGGLPMTIPQVDYSNLSTADLVIMTPPYKKISTKPSLPPYTVTYKTTGEVLVDQHFPDWETDWTMCYGTYPVTVNGIDLQAYGGAVFDIATLGDRKFFITSATDCVYELLANGAKQTLVCGLGANPSAIIVNPLGFLVVSTLPGYEKFKGTAIPVLPVKLWKIDIGVDPVTATQIAALPIPSDYTILKNVASSYIFPFTTLAMPTTLRMPITLTSSGEYIVGDVGAKRVYKVSADGTTITEISTLPLLIAALTWAPNDVLYMLSPPLLGMKNDGLGKFVIKGVTLSAWDPNASTWIELLELDGYDNVGSMSWATSAVPCPEEFADAGLTMCMLPEGVFMKAIPDQTAVVFFVSDPITARILSIPLDMSGDDAGADGEGGI